ncbi:MAG TPA: hypothetical protein VFW33_01990 [Gemmataceae bacterium]|nr:hypothetical protein [Gemmataceae bacterium]
MVAAPSPNADAGEAELIAAAIRATLWNPASLSKLATLSIPPTFANGSAPLLGIAGEDPVRGCGRARRRADILPGRSILSTGGLHPRYSRSSGGVAGELRLMGMGDLEMPKDRRIELYANERDGKPLTLVKSIGPDGLPASQADVIRALEGTVQALNTFPRRGRCQLVVIEDGVIIAVEGWNSRQLIWCN